MHKERDTTHRAGDSPVAHTGKASGRPSTARRAADLQPSRRGPSASRRAGWRESRALDADRQEPIDLLATLLVRCGYVRDSIPLLFQDALARVPIGLGDDGAAPFALTSESAQIITLWYMTPGYLDAHGDPLPLAARGAAPSIEALMQSINPKANLEDVLDCLFATRAVKKRGSLYLPRARAMSYRHAPKYKHAHALHAVTGLLRTIEHNARTTRPPRWFEYTVDGSVPQRQRKQFDREFRRAAHQMMRDVDALMLRLAKKKSPREDCVPLCVGMCFSESRALTLPPAIRRRKGRIQHRIST